MEFSSYLQAIQKVAGEKAGKKYQILNRFARKIIAESKDLNLIEVYPSEELPEPLIPLVKLEIARILKKPQGVVDAIKSDDQVVFERALRVKWFFNGSVDNYPNVHHFQSHILPYISLNNRIKIIKVLASNLATKQPALAREFYLSLSEMYGDNQAQSLLKACSESFIWDTIIKRQIVLNINEVNYLFLKYPDLIVKYLKLGKYTNDYYTRNLHDVSLYQYKNFLPMLLKKYSKDLVELINAAQNTFGIQLNSHHTNIFLKNEVDEFIKNPELFISMLSLKTITEKLPRAQFEIIFQKLFPKDMDEFNFHKLFDHLEYIPEDQKMQLLLSTFQKVYNKNLLECQDLVVPEMLPLLSPEERANQARYKLKTDKDWHLYIVEKSWRCYLPTEESIPLMKDQIAKSKEASDRMSIIQQMIYTCKVNDDKSALLEVLKYITIRHKNEQNWVLTQALLKLSIDFELEYLSIEHWDVLYSFIKFLHVKNVLINDLSTALSVVAAGIHFDLLNNRSVTEKINLYTELNITGWMPLWNILQKTPQYERKCLEEFIKSIPIIYPKISKKEAHSWPNVINNFAEAIYDFNKRNDKAKDKLENLSIKNYSWLLDAVKKLICDKSQEKERRSLDDLKSLLKINELDLYNLWVDEEEKQSAVELNEALVILKYNPQKILDYWKVYYEKCKKEIYQRSGQRFLKSCRWYQDIPVKFVEMSTKDVKENKDSRAIIILAILLEGSAFEKFITPYAPKSSVVNIEGDDAKADHMLEFSIPASVNLVNPPVSLDFILRFCEGDYIHVILRCLVNVGRRIAVDKLLPFYEELMSRKVSVKKHGIRLFRDVASATQLRNTLINLWREEKHRSIRLLIVENIVDAFMTQPCSQTWEMMNECFDSLTIDDRDALETIAKIDRVPNEYVADYVRKLLIVFKKIGNPDDDFGRQGVWYHTERLLQHLPVKVAVLFPEELHEEILKTYLADLSLPKQILSAAQRYLVTCYIAPAKDKLEYRLKNFSDIFIGIIKDNLDISRDDITSYSGNYFVYSLMKNIVFSMEYCLDKTKFINVALDAFLLVSKPQLAPEFYCNLTFAALYNDKISPKEFAAQIIKILPSLIDIFSVGFVSTIANFLFDLIELFYYDTKDEAILDIIEFLLELNNDHAIFLGTALLLCRDKLSTVRFWQLMKVLRQHKHPLVVANAYMAINKFDC